MAAKKDPIANLGWVLHMTALCTSAFLAQLLLRAIPALARYWIWVVLGMMLLAGLACFLWLKHRPDELLPGRFKGFAVGAAVGVLVFLGAEVLLRLTELLVDLTADQRSIATVRLACPVIFGIIGALKHKDDNFEEDHNNG